MQTSNVAGERIAETEPRPNVCAELMSVDDVGDMLRCSSRHVYRMSDNGKMPPPVRLGALVRWSRAALMKWISDGCPPARTVKAGPR